ncbi:MAG: lysostaphin resistance A-like protein [Parvibaculaceae bacterium]
MTFVDRILGPQKPLEPSSWRPVAAVAACLGLGVLAAACAFVMAIAVAGLHFSTDGTVTAAECVLSLGEASPVCHTAEFWFVDLLYILLPAGLLLATHFRRNGSLAHCLLLRSPEWRLWQYAVFALICVVATGVSHQAVWFLTELSGGNTANLLTDFHTFRQHVLSDSLSGSLLFVMFVVVLAPITEELLFRGFLFSALRETRLGSVGSAVVLSGVWASLHWGYSWQSVALLFAQGLLYAYAVRRTGSIWPAIVGHGVNNLIAVVTVIVYQTIS